MGERRRRSVVFGLASHLLRCPGCDVIGYVLWNGVKILWKRLSRVDIEISIRSIDVKLMRVRLSDMANRIMMVRSFEYN